MPGPKAALQNVVTKDLATHLQKQFSKQIISGGRSFLPKLNDLIQQGKIEEEQKKALEAALAALGITTGPPGSTPPPPAPHLDSISRFRSAQLRSGFCVGSC
jgi:hypothetical protein